MVLHLLKDETTDVNKGGQSVAYKEFQDRM